MFATLSVTIPSLAGHTATTFSQSFGMTTPGPNTVTAAVDITNQITEGNETNNSYSQTFTVLPTYQKEGDMTLKQGETTQLHNGYILHNYYPGAGTGKVKFKIYDGAYQVIADSGLLGVGETWNNMPKGLMGVSITVNAIDQTDPLPGKWTATINVTSTTIISTTGLNQKIASTPSTPPDPLAGIDIITATPITRPSNQMASILAGLQAQLDAIAQALKNLRP